jgi:hypothetical protein
LIDTDQLEFRISPTFPYPVRFHPRTAANSLVNGTILGVTNVTNPIPSGEAPLVGAPVSTAMNLLMPSVGAGAAESTNVVGARIITCGYRLYYTGAAALAAGVVVVDNLQARITTVGSSNGTNTQYMYSAAGATANVSNSAGLAAFVTVDTTPFEYSTMTSDQVVLRPENGLHGVLKMTKLATDHPYVPWYDTGAFVLQSLSAASNTYTNIFCGVDGLTGPTGKLGCQFWDDAFQEVNIKLSTAAQFRLEVTMCMEWELAMQSNIIDLARPSPLYDDMTLRKDMLLNSMVVPAPFSQPPLDIMMRQLNIGGRQSVRSAKPKQRKPQQTQASPKARPKQTGKAARRRRNRQRRRAKANAR